MSAINKYHLTYFELLLRSSFFITTQTLAITLVLFTILLSQRNIYISALIHPKELYLTSGLWHMSSGTFWFAFWSETPFALIRAILIYALPVSLIIFIVLSYKIQHDYNKYLKKLK